MSLRALLGGASKCRTIDVCDIFGDGSGKALYRLDGNANDESGNYHGTETDVTYGGGVYERGAVFNGSSSVVATTYPQPTGAFSISAWFKTSQTATYSILSSSNSGASAGVNFDVNSSKVRFGVIGIMSTSLFSTTLVNDNAWRLATVTWDGTTNSNGIKLYINGALEGQMTAISTTITASGVPFRIGKYGDASFWFNGSIDQVRIFNRAITATEVATLYAECAPTSTVDNINPFEDGSLKALYQFNGDATDKTGVYNGTATNVTYGTGKFGNCAVFNGTSSKVDTSIPSSSFLTFSLTGWAKAGADTTGMIVNKGYTGLTYRYNNVSTQVALEYYTTAWQASVLGTIPVGTWFYYAITYSSGILKAYINGDLKASISATITDFSANIFYGMYRSGASYFNGSIDQARFFNKALTPMEVASLYNETTPLEEPMHSLVDPFKDGSGKALYRLDGNALDESGNYNGTATSVTYGAGRFGRAGVFNGSAYISKSAPPPITGDVDLTFSLWVYVTTNVSQECIAISDGAVSYNNKFLFGSDASGKLIVSYYGGTYTGASSTLPINSWTHIVVTRTTADVITFYINGTQTNSGTTSEASVGIGNYPFYIGSNGFGNHISSGSMIDQVRIFNRTLTASEVTALYQEI